MKLINTVIANIHTNTKAEWYEVNSKEFETLKVNIDYSTIPMTNGVTARTFYRKDGSQIKEQANGRKFLIKFVK
tara:strand:- start:670 stop:891 length:222 start_codon:yes stop_codon:yes gene_type:complete